MASKEIVTPTKPGKEQSSPKGGKSKTGELTEDELEKASGGAAGAGIVKTTEAPCYCRGTMISTLRGEVAVEDMAIGDRVVTAAGRLRSIRWIGHRTYDGRFIAGNREVLPIRVAAGALAEGLPRRDLWVSPEHALFLDGVLVPVRLLINGVSISQAESVERVDYFHIELETHDVIVAEGAPAETFLNSDGCRAVFHNAGEYAALYPEDSAPSSRFCAPRLGAGSAELEAIWTRLAARACSGAPVQRPKRPVDRVA
jgi:hypothetical protein